MWVPKEDPKLEIRVRETDHCTRESFTQTEKVVAEKARQGKFQPAGGGAVCPPFPPLPPWMLHILLWGAALGDGSSLKLLCSSHLGEAWEKGLKRIRSQLISRSPKIKIFYLLDRQVGTKAPFPSCLTLCYNLSRFSLLLGTSCLIEELQMNLLN